MRTDGDDDSTGGDLAPVSLVLIAAMFVGIYLAMASLLPQSEFRPWLLASALLGGLVVGVGVARLTPSRTRAAREPKGHSRSAGAARATLIGLSGLGLILAQHLSVSGLEWLTIGGGALATGGAGHAWVKRRRGSTPSRTH